MGEHRHHRKTYYAATFVFLHFIAMIMLLVSMGAFGYTWWYYIDTQIDGVGTTTYYDGKVSIAMK